MSGSSNSPKLRARPNGKAFSLELFSDEIILMILKSVITPLQRQCDGHDGPSSSKTIWNIALCSRRLFEIAEPFLFHQLEHGRNEPKALPLLLCRILAKPEMKKHVQKVQTRAIKASEDREDSDEDSDDEMTVYDGDSIDLSVI